MGRRPQSVYTRRNLTCFRAVFPQLLNDYSAPCSPVSPARNIWCCRSPAGMSKDCDSDYMRREEFTSSMPPQQPGKPAARADMARATSDMTLFSAGKSLVYGRQRAREKPRGAYACPMSACRRLIGPGVCNDVRQRRMILGFPAFDGKPAVPSLLP